MDWKNDRMTQNEKRQSSGRNVTGRLLIAAGCIIAAVAAFVLYAMKPQDGKDAAVNAACPGAKEKAAALRPLAHGEVAAFGVVDAPRPLPELKFTGEGGAPVRLADFKGRSVLLNLWATWCVPCRQEMPALDQLQGALGGPDFTVVAVNVDTARLERPKAFLKEIGVKNLGFYADSSADILQTLKGAGAGLGLPTTVLVDKNGCALGVMAGPAQWDSPDAQALIAAAKG
jgi:thiol-disulfide isomerase/thioredoxin